MSCSPRPRPPRKVGWVEFFTRPTEVAVTVGLVKTRPTLLTIGRKAVAGKPDDLWNLEDGSDAHDIGHRLDGGDVVIRKCPIERPNGGREFPCAFQSEEFRAA